MDGQIAILRQSRGPWDFQRYPLPDPEPGAILVRITYANVCGSDLHTWRGESPLQPGGRTMGHEMAGRVMALGQHCEAETKTDPLASGFAGALRQGDSLVVQGAGGLGLNMIAAARDMGAGLIIAIDGIPGRLQLPRALDFIQRSRKRVPWDRVISHTFPLEEINQAFEQAEWMGRDPVDAVITRAAVIP